MELRYERHYFTFFVKYFLENVRSNLLCGDGLDLATSSFLTCSENHFISNKLSLLPSSLSCIKKPKWRQTEYVKMTAILLFILKCNDLVSHNCKIHIENASIILTALKIPGITNISRLIQHYILLFPF